MSSNHILGARFQALYKITIIYGVRKERIITLYYSPQARSRVISIIYIVVDGELLP